MKIYIGKVIAVCPECQGDEWLIVDSAASFSVLSELVCGRCSHVETYADLALKVPLDSDAKSDGAQ